MSSARKIAGYLDRKETLTHQYISLKDAYKQEEDYAGLANVFDILKHLDELVYEYHVYKSYLEATKKPISEADKKEMKEMENLIRKLEDDTSLSYLTENASRLAIVRRELVENGKEGGRVIQGYDISPKFSSSVPFTTEPPPVSGSSQDKNGSSASGEDLPSLRNITWCKRLTQIVFEASNVESSLQKDKLQYITTHVRDEFQHHCTRDLTRYLLYHYIDGESYGFREAFDEAYSKVSPSLSIEKRIELIGKELKARKDPSTPVTSDYIIRCGIWMREIFQRTYGKITEPAENYQ